MMPRWSRPPERNTSEWIQTFGKSPRLAVVNRIASDLSFIQGKLFEVDTNGKEREICKHPFLDFWRGLNPLYEYSCSSMWQLHEIYLLLKGEGYFIIERDEIGLPCELWPVPVHWVFMTPYLDFPYYRIRTQSGSIMEVPVEDMFIQKSLNPFDPFMRGLGEAESIAREVETDAYAAEFQKKFFYNDATPNLVIGMTGASPDQQKRFKADWEDKHKGVHNSHRVSTVGGDISVHKLVDHMKDLDMVEGRKFLRNAALEHFGVPREIMGITESSNRATSEAAQFIYVQNVLDPRLRRREESVNRQLVSAFGDNLIFRYDDIVPRNKDFDKARAINGWNAGLLTKNEGRELLGFEPAETGGDTFKNEFDMFWDDEVDINIDSDEADADDDMIDISDSYEGKSRKISLTAARQSEDVAMRQNVAAFEIAMMKYFRAQTKRIMASLGEGAKSEVTLWSGIGQYMGADGISNAIAWNALATQQQLQLAGGFVDGLIDWAQEIKVLQSTFEPLWRQSYNAGAAQAQKLYGLRAIQRPELISTAKLRGGQRIVGIEQTTKNAISKVVADGIANGNSTKTIADSIKQEMGATNARAKLIAQQEVSVSLTTGQYDMVCAAGATTKTWHHRPQKNPRDGTPTGAPDHVSMNGETVGIDEKFSNGLMQPRDPNGPAKEVIKCHCYMTYGGL